MRIIPKKCKVTPTVWRDLTLFDMILGFVMFIIAFFIAFSNFEYKWAILLAFVSFCVMLFFKDGEERMYNDLIYILRYIFSRKTYSKEKKKNVSALIPFKAIQEDGIINYGDYLGAVISIGSVEFGLLDEFEQDKRISMIAALFNGLGDKTVAQLVKIDRPINYDDISMKLFEKLVAAKNESPLDKAKITILESRLQQIDSINNVVKQYRPYYYLVVYENERDDLLRNVDFIRTKLDTTELSAEMLNAKDVALFFKYCFSRNFEEREIDDININDYAEFIKPNKIKFTSSGHICDDIYSFTCSISDYPLVVGNAWGAGLFNIDNTKVVLSIKPVDKKKAVKRIDNALAEINGRRGNTNKISKAISQETHAETMTELAAKLQSDNEMLFDCTLTITGFNNTKEDNIAFRKNLRRQIQSGGFSVNNLKGRQFEGFATSSISRKMCLRNQECGINSESLAAVFPFVFTSIIEPNGITLGYEYYPVIINIWKRDFKKYLNSNVVVFGKSGSGKSFFIKTLLSLLYSDNTKIFILDPENEYLYICNNFGGRFIDVGNATEGKINPLHIYQILTEDGTAASPKAVFSAHLLFLESFFAITLKGIPSDALEELNNLITKLYEKKKIFSTTDCSKLKAEDFPIFDDLKQLVDDELAAETSIMRKQNLERIKTYATKFATGGRYANLWNSPSTLTTDERLVIFNFQSLFAAKNNIVANAQMLVIMRYLDQQIINARESNRNAKTDPIHPVVVLDEGYNFIDAEYPVALDFVYLWYKRIRKYNGSIMFLTQNLADVLKNEKIIQKTTAIINNAQYSFLFSLAPADLEILTDLYKNAGQINAVERNQIETASNGECFVICSSCERTSFKVVASDVVYTLFDKPNAMNLIATGNLSNPKEK